MSNNQTGDRFELVTADLISQIDFDFILKEIDEHSYSKYRDQFLNKAKQCKSVDEPLFQCFQFLESVFSMRANIEDSSIPFQPMFDMNDGSRSLTYTDLTDENLECLKPILEVKTNPLLRARIGDILWWCKKDWPAGCIAMEAMLEFSSENVKTKNWLKASQVLNRAVQIWRASGRKKETAEKLIKLFDEVFDFSNQEPENFYRVIFLKILVKNGLWDDSSQLIEKIRIASNASTKQNNYEKAQAYLTLSRDIAVSTKLDDERDKIEQNIIDCYLEEIESKRSLGANASLLSISYQKAIEACRRFGGRREMVDKLHSEVNELREKEIHKDMKKTSAPIPNADEIYKSHFNKIKELSLDEAISYIANLSIPKKIDELEAQVKDRIIMSPLSAIIPRHTFDDKGRLTDVRNGASTSNPIEDSSLVYSEMITEEVFRQQVYSSISIEACRSSIIEHHPTNEFTFYPMLEMNPFVDGDRFDLFNKGLLAGLYGDWVTCAHILIPQLENSIRNVMERSGALVTYLKDDQTQTEFDLNTLLYYPEADKIFGKDIIFMLRVLLVEKTGNALRNHLAHGRMSSYSFCVENIGYLWAVTIFLCVNYRRLYLSQSTQSDSKS